MIKKTLGLLAPLLGFAVVATPNAATAVQIGPGSINLNYFDSIQLVNNAVDFAPGSTDFVPGDIANGGVFNINIGEGGFVDFGFFDDQTLTGVDGISVDFYIPSNLIPAVDGNPAGEFANGVEYDLIDIGLGVETVTDGKGDSMEGIPIIFYDLTENGVFDDEDDAIFYATSFIRSSTPQNGTFDTSVSFGGFMFTPGDAFHITTIDSSLFNGATNTDPETLVAIDGPPPTELPDPPASDLTNLDGVQTIDAASVPEPGTIVATLVSCGIAGLFSKRKGKKERQS